MNRNRAKTVVVTSGVMVLATVGRLAAEYIVPPADERVSHAHVIVVGTLRNVVSEVRDGFDYDIGVIEVATVLAGDVKPGDRLKIQWTNATEITCPRTGHPRAQEKLALWLLDSPEDGVYRGGFPEYTIVLSDSPTLGSFQRELHAAALKGELAPTVARVAEFVKSRGWSRAR